MSDELDDGKFWLPSHFLVDDDNNLLTTFPCPIHSKASLSLSTSPQSTLFGCDCNLQDSLSASSSDNSLDSDTLELLNKAAGEVSKIQSRNETSTNTTTSTGTGFFDCSRTINMKTNNNTNTVPSARPRPHVPSVLPPSVSFQQRYPPRFPPPMMWGPVQLSQLQQQKIATKNNNENNEINNNNKRSQGLSPVAWPPLQGQSQVQGCRPVTSVYAGAPRETVGTGVFLPRRVGSPVESKKKSVGNTIKTKNNNGSQQRNAHSIKDSLDEIELPSEWIY